MKVIDLRFWWFMLVIFGIFLSDGPGRRRYWFKSVINNTCHLYKQFPASVTSIEISGFLKAYFIGSFHIFPIRI